MPTVRDIVDAAAALIGQAAEDKNLSDYNAERMRLRLQTMLDNWSTLRYMIFSTRVESFTMVAGTRSYSSTLLASGRPVRVVSATVVLDQITYPVELVSSDYFSSIAYKPTTAIPGKLYAEMTMPNATFHFWPTPYAAFRADLECMWGLAQVPTLATNLFLPEGYQAAMENNLGVWSADLFGRTPSDTLKTLARETYRNIKRNNIVPDEMTTGLNPDQARTFDFLYKGF